MEKYFVAILFSLNCLLATAQNMPSLLSGKNINATFSIIAYDADQQEWGIAVATDNIYVGNSTIYIEPGVGAFSVIAETNPDYAINGLSQLKQGATIEQAIRFTKAKDRQAHYRQVSGIDSSGNVFAFTGEALHYWNGKAGHFPGNQFVVMGNQLGEAVLESMASTFEQATGTLAERLLASLLAGQMAGGQVTGKQSAALVVKGSNNEWYNQIDLRVDHSEEPFKELQALLNYHYGRIRLNQSIYAYHAGNTKRANTKLAEAEALLNGWNSIYSKIAFAHSLMGKDNQAVRWIQKALLENLNWKVNLPAFFYLRKHSALSSLIAPDNFKLKDWENAISMLLRLNRGQEAVEVAKEVLAKGESSSYLQYLLGKGHAQVGDHLEAKKALAKALEMDSGNVEARLMLEEMNK
ncbi:MAG: DUF1028 domain-containing protein [Bacteroidota bacterium]